MDQRPNPVWAPTDDDVTTAQVTSLAETLGHKDFDSLYAWSIAHPDACWEGMMRWLGIRWRAPYSSYVDLSEGKAFPRWFPGRKIDWVESIFAPCMDDARSERLAVVAEDEGGRGRRTHFRPIARRCPGVRGWASSSASRSGRSVPDIWIHGDLAIQYELHVLPLRPFRRHA
ncbi:MULTISPECIES: acetyl-coenzyme A synthetase N-terminal domain-containing protein [unclassified Caballeronia]|uniref:acetyl-coenzyme A synthetase N-terminal domain-containing protein n=1 Tax=unclassified Caballeronia TaxID=2646786 RepID=UPI0032EAADF2